MESTLEKTVPMDNRELLLAYKRTYLHLKKVITINEAKAIDAQDLKEVELCEQQMQELDTLYQETMKKFDGGRYP
jgi:hypothetical protein